MECPHSPRRWREEAEAQMASGPKKGAIFIHRLWDD